MKQYVAILASITMTVSFASCGPPTVRNYAAALAANTGHLNDQFEQLTKSRQEIDVGRDRLLNMLELSTLRAENYNERRLAEWMAIKNDPAFKERNELFNILRAHTDAAANREATLELLVDKVVKARSQAKGQRSEQLTETAKHLAALSKEPTVEGQVQFLAGYAKTVEESLKKAKDDAKKASDAARSKIDAVEVNKTSP